MAHNINIENGKANMMYVGETPWHKLGTKLDNPATAQEAIMVSGLNYVVEKEKVLLESGIVVPDTYATVRKDNNNILGVVGNVYKVMQNADAFNFFDTVVGDGKAIYHSAGALGKGERIWMLAKLPGDVIVKDVENTEKYLLLTNSFDGTSPVKMFFTPVRVVCQNTLNMAIKGAKDGISIRHTQSMSGKVDEARRILGLSINYYSEFEKLANQLSDVSLTMKKAEEYFDTVLGPVKEDESTRRQNTKAELLNLFEHGKGNQHPAVRGSLWCAYNAVTEYSDYHKTIKNIDKDATNRLNSLWFGSGANMKMNAWEKAVALV